MQPDLEGQSIFARLASAIDNSWTSQARPEQLPPKGDWTTWLILAGRGFGKTRTGAEWVRSLAENSAVSRIALVGPTAADVRDVMVEGESGILSICPNWNRPAYEPSKRRLTWPNGVQAAMFSSEEPERLRGPQHGAAWCDELAAWRNVEETWSMLNFGLRIGTLPRTTITTTPKPIKILKELVKNADGHVSITRGSTYDNRDNLAPAFFSQIVKRYEGTRLGRQELNAEILEDIEGALWTRDSIEAGRVPKNTMLEFQRIVIAVDPAVSNNEDSDETGIIVAALGFDGEGYVLEDLSGRYTPTEWATKAVGAYRRYRADRIVAEVNQGGLLVENTIRVIDPNVSLRMVHASRGKLIRAEPVSALYEQRRVHHLGGFFELEDQLCSFAPGSKDSPDRLDALVYAITDLMVERQGAVLCFGGV